jgi:hypothetical protein
MSTDIVEQLGERLDRQYVGNENTVLRLRAALIQMVDEGCDYMRRNNLGDPEREQTIKVARAALRL